MAGSYKLTPIEEQTLQGILEDVNAPLRDLGKKQEDFSEEDIAFTMQKHGLSREEVLRRMGE